MSEYFSPPDFSNTTVIDKRKFKNNYLLHIGLFIATFITTTLAGVEWTTGTMGPYDLQTIMKGLPYSVSIMLMISFHEFGHFFAAKFHKVKATLPYYIPFPPIPYFINFGTMGAVIRTRSVVYSKKAMFDIGVAGPIAGFIFTLALLIYGFTHLPGQEYLLKIHPDYFSPDYGKGGISLIFGDTLLFSFIRNLFEQPGAFIPPMSEVYHYPYLCVGWFGLFITAMNMIPVGQLDGGHISYTIFGKENHYKISVVSFILLFVIGIIGIVDAILELNFGIGWSGWLFWALVLYFIIKLHHPPVYDESKLDPVRKFIGYFSFFILVITFSPAPIVLTMAV